MMLYVTQSKLVIGLGSNLGNGPVNLELALRKLAEAFGSKPLTSSIYYSEPVELTEQPWFYNQVTCFEVADKIQPTTILRILKKIESEMGRVTTVRYGPRIIDLDLLFYEDWVMETASLTIPHPKITERSFVLMPLNEILPEWIHPQTGEKISELFEKNRSRLAECKLWSTNLRE